MPLNSRLLPRLHALAASASFVLAITVLPAATPETGRIEGRVFDARRGEYLENARITVEGTRLEVLTDAVGQYRLDDVPAGSVKLDVFFTGRGSQTEAVMVKPGRSVQHDITLGSAQQDQVVKLDTVVVGSTKEMDGAAYATNEQRFARNIMSVVSADEFGTIADGSVGEFMKFLPGITSDYTGGDARRFSINGVPAGNVPISMGGFDMASAAGAGTGRQVELDQVSINNISRIEVNRSPTAESPGSALAGSVNFVPRSAFERSRPVYNYSVAFLMKDAERAFLRRTPGPGYGGDRSYKILPGVDVSAVVPVNKRFGFTVSAGYSIQYTPQSYSQMNWRGANGVTNTSATSTTGLPDTTPDKPYLTDYSTRDSGKDTTRHSFATTVDWRLSRPDRLTFGFQYGMLKEHFATRTMTYVINRVAPGAWSPTYTQGSASTFPATGTAVNAGQINIANSGRIRPGRTLMPSLRWLHNGPIWRSDAGFSYSTSRIHYQDIDKGFFNGANYRRTNVTIRYDDIFYLRPGQITVADPSGAAVDPYALDTYSMVSATSTRQKTYDTKRQAYANAAREFNVRDVPVSLKAGLDARTQVRDLRGVGTETYNWVGADGRASTTPYTTAGLRNDDSALPFLDASYSTRVPDFGWPKMQWVDNQKLRSFVAANPTYMTQSATADYTSATNASKWAREIISAAFLRADVQLLRRRLVFTGGLRAEQTNIRAQGPLSDPTRNFQPDEKGGYVLGANKQPLPITTDAFEALKLTLVDRGYEARKEYLRLFPSLNARYNVTENLLVRAAYYQTVGRPDFNQYSGGLTLPNTELPNSSSNRITVSNASLKAWQAETYMVRLEYYFPNGGQLTASTFIRDIKNQFGSSVTQVTPEFLAIYGVSYDEYGQYDVSTQFNVAKAVRMRGFEFDVSQPLTFLPAWAQGLRFTANVSSQRAVETDSFQSMNPLVVNWGLSLSRRKYTLRINENYRGVQRRGPVTGRSLEPGTYNYASKRLYVDVNGEYRVRRYLSLFVSLRNVGDATEDTKVYGPHTPAYARFRQRDDYASLWTAGVKGTF